MSIGKGRSRKDLATSPTVRTIKATSRKRNSSAWQEEITAKLSEARGPIIFPCDLQWGAPYLVEALAADNDVVWVELARAESRRTVLSNVGQLNNDMSPKEQLRALLAHLEASPPRYVALFGCEYDPEFAQALLRLSGTTTVVLQYSRLPVDISPPPHCLVLDVVSLALSEQGAKELSADKVGEGQAALFLEASGGCYEAFLTLVHAEAKLGPPARPHATTPAPIGTAVDEVVNDSLGLLIRRSRWQEALFLAALYRPDAVEAVLERAGDDLWLQADETRVYASLSALPVFYKQDPKVLCALLQSALATGKEAEVLEDVERALEHDALPKLRALYAESLFRAGEVVDGLQQAERAALNESSPTTLLIYGSALGASNPVRGKEILENGLKLAESKENRHLTVQLVLALSARLNALGKYLAASEWAEWGLVLLANAKSKATIDEVILTNELLYARIFTDSITPQMLAAQKERLSHLETIHPLIARTFRSTLADCALAIGDVESALAIYERLWEGNTKRWNLGRLANLYVRALLEVGQTDEALRVASKAINLHDHLPFTKRRRGLLAYGMALSATDPEKALHTLEQSVEDMQNPLFVSRLDQATLFLAQTKLQLGHADFLDTLATENNQLKNISAVGLRYLAGPADIFQNIFDTLTGAGAPLQLRLLGNSTMRYRGRDEQLRLKFAEILAVLTLHPEGLSGERAATYIYRDAENASSCKSEINRLRALLPIRSRPYRLPCDVWADFTELARALEGGKVEEALSLYSGPLLPESEAPKIVELRRHLEESLRELVLASDEAETLWQATEAFGDAPEVWAKLVALLPVSDPRHTISQVRLATLKEYWEL